MIGTGYEFRLSWLVPALARVLCTRAERGLHLHLGDNTDLLGLSMSTEGTNKNTVREFTHIFKNEHNVELVFRGALRDVPERRSIPRGSDPFVRDVARDRRRGGGVAGADSLRTAS